MRTQSVISVSILSLVCCAAQIKAPELPIALSPLLKALAAPDLIDVPELTERIQRRGIDFDLDQQLGEILAAAFKGKRDPKQVEALVTACLRGCQNCRARILAPLTKEELKTLLQWRFTPEAILLEARTRGVKDVEISATAANELRAAGANEDLVNLLVPDDRIPIDPLPGFKALSLKRAEEYDLSAPEGWLKITIELPKKSESEFIFKHNGLFAKAKSGGEPVGFGAYFNKPAPRNTDEKSIKHEVGVDNTDERSLLARKLTPKTKPEVKLSYVLADAEGRNAFRFVITNKDTSPQRCSVYLRWKVATPKASNLLQGERRWS